MKVNWRQQQRWQQRRGQKCCVWSAAATDPSPNPINTGLFSLHRRAYSASTSASASGASNSLGARAVRSSPPSTMAPTEIMTMEDYCTCHTHAALLLPGHQAILGTRGGGCRFISQDSARICLQTWPRSRDAAMAAPSASRFLFRHANAPDRRLGQPAHQVWSILALPFLFALLQAARSAWRTWT